MQVTVKLQKIEIVGNVSFWEDTDPGFKRHAGSVYFGSDSNYFGFLMHDGSVELHTDSAPSGIYSRRRMGIFKPENQKEILIRLSKMQ